MQWRFAAQFALAAMFLFFALGAAAQTTNGLSDAEIQGRILPGNFWNNSQLQILFRMEFWKFAMERKQRLMCQSDFRPW